MTVHTMPVNTGLVRQRRGAEHEPRPVPWQAMIWVTWRHHRGLLIGVLAAFLAAVLAMLVVGLRIHQDYAALAACHPAASAACAQLSNYFGSTDWHEGNGIHVAVQVAPALLALFAGPPVLASEFENGTFRYAWTQGIGRVRWTATRLAILAAVITAAALVLSLECTWFFGPFLKTQGVTTTSPGVFGTSGVVYAAWALTALCLGTFAGALLRRLLPAMLVTLAAYLALAAVTWFYLRGHYPVGTFWPMQLFESAWLLALSAALVAATLRLIRRRAA
jgi:hypothetical protein